MAPRIHAYIPDILIEEHILPRLPTKSIGRWRCVSKSWRSLLSTPGFSKSHLKLYTNNPDQPEDILITQDFGFGDGVFLVNFSTSGNSRNDGVSTRVSLPYDSKGKVTSLGPSCQGLVLLIVTDYRDFPEKWFYILMNPITEEYVEYFPDIPCDNGFGLGYDSVSDDYKILSFPPEKGDVDVYSVKMKTRRRLSSVVDSRYELNRCNDHGVFLDGYIYWTAFDGERRYYVLAAFDLARERFEYLPLPRGPDENQASRLTIKVLEGCLALIAEIPACVFDIWIMKEYGVQDSWIRFGSIDAIMDLYQESVWRPARFVCLLNRDEAVIYSDRFFKYNVRNNKDRRYLDIPDIHFEYDEEVIPFRGSLVSPNLRTDT